jgi:hypothetical protein
MASSRDTGPSEEREAPQLLFTSPSFGPRRQPADPADNESRMHRRHRPRERLPLSAGGPRSSASSIYMGSYSKSPRHSRTSIKSPGNSTPGTPRHSMNHENLESLLENLNLDLETYGVEELRDGFFDGSFFKPPKVDHEDLLKDAEYTLPAAFKKGNPLSPKAFLPGQWRAIKNVARDVTTTRAGIKLTKSFLAFFIAYILCLVPPIQIWLGQYSYIMVLSTIINHPGRTIGAQIDGTFLTIIGSATGLGWGAFALWLSDSTSVARRGYGGILAAFLVIFMGTIAALRTYYIRLYQMVLCAGFAVIYTCLADTSEAIDWRKLFNYGIPWLFGQALCLLICCTIFPDAGARPLAVNLHNAFEAMHKGLVLPQLDNTTQHRQLAWIFVNLSQTYRDLVLDISLTRFRPSDVMSLRNLMQAVVRSLLSLNTETQLFDEMEKKTEFQEATRNLAKPQDGTVIDVDASPKRPSVFRSNTEERAVKLVASKLAEPTSNLLKCMRNSLERCDAVLMGMSGYRKYLGPPESTSSDIVGVLTKIRKVIIKYDEEEESLLDNPALPPTYSNHPQVVELFLFVHPIRQAATTVEALLVKVMEMQQRHRGWRIYLPSYPFGKSLQRTNAQVRHDRGGVTAGYYFRSQSQLARTMRGMANVYKPLPRHHNAKEKQETPKPGIERAETLGKYEEEDVSMDHNSQASKQKKLRYKLWVILHDLQGFETRFALKVVIVTSLLSVPAWLEQSRLWWNQNESWWGVVMAWVMFHPR